MNFKKVFSVYFLCFLYKIYKKDWILSNDNFYINSSKKENKSLFENELIEPDFKKKVVLIKKNKIQKGWYFFGILHVGENRNSLLKIKTSNYSSQSRPAFANRRRWRVLRIKRNCNLTLEISQVKNPLNIKEIWLIKIPYLFAWYKIKKRIKRNSSRIYINELSKQELWRKYNLILNKQFKKHKSFGYDEWIKFSENPIYNSISKNLKFSNHNNEDVLIDLDSFKKFSIINKKWILIHRPNILISEKLADIIKWIEKQKKVVSIFYCDEDHLSDNKKREGPIFKSAWNRELFWTDYLYSSHWIVSIDLWKKYYKKMSLLKLINYDQIVFFIIGQLIKENKENRIKHVPLILTHRLNNFYNYFNDEIIKIYNKNLNLHLNEIYPNIFVKKNNENEIDSSYLEWANPKEVFISIIIPTKDNINLLDKCLNSIYKFSSKLPIEIIIVNNNSTEEKSLKYFNQLKCKFIKNISHRIIDFNFEFNYSKINNYAVSFSRGNTLILLNNDVEILSENWDLYLSSNANREDIGCVGAKLIFEDYTIQHAGVILGIGGVAGHSHKYFKHDSKGYHGRLSKAQEYSAVTAACLCITKQKWNKVCGLDEINLPVNYNDVDLCLKLRKLNLKNIFLPQVLAIHHESKSRGQPMGENYIKWKKEFRFMQNKWQDLIKKDPYYSPHLSLEEEDWSIAINKNNIFLR